MDPAPAWSGGWVNSRLGVALESAPGPVGLDLTDAVGLALRRNPRRAHLLVSRLLGKHVPTDPRLVYGAGRLLGVLVADALADALDGRRPGGRAPARSVAGELLRACLSPDRTACDRAAAAVELLACVEAASVEAASVDAVPGTRVAVLGYAETATALGHAVADSLGAPYVHSTRRPVPGVVPLPGFTEEHSHAQEHLLLPEHAELVTAAEVLVLVDDEFSTGRTVLNTVRALHRAASHRRYVLASLVDVRSPADRDRLAGEVAGLGAAVDVVTLATGTITLPADLPRAAADLMADLATDLVTESVTESMAEPAAERAGQDDVAHDGRRPGAEVRRLRPGHWPAGTRDGGRHGFSPEHRDRLREAMRHLAVQLSDGTIGPRVLVLGFEELMYAPQVLGIELAALLGPRCSVRSSSTTRSPVFALDEPGYAVRTRLVFGSCDDPADGAGPRFAYNVAPSTGQAGPRFDDIVLVVDTPADTPALTAHDGPVSALRTCCARLHLVTLPSYRPGG